MQQSDSTQSMVDDIHNILKCPVSGETLRPLLMDELGSLNSQMRRGNLRRLDGTAVNHEIEGGYITESRRFAYSIREGIIVLLTDLAIVLDDQYVSDASRVACSETQQVQSFYDKVGWQKTEDGEYEDTARFVDTRPVLHSYFFKCNNRIKKHMKKKGKYLVDVACGPIHYDSYRAMSEGYDFRICIDVSMQALREAKKQMGSRGIYLMADITNMPLRDQSVDDVISLHTLYHVPADKQITALKELHRILKPGATAVVIYTWGRHSLLMRWAMWPIRALERMRSLPKRNDGSPTLNEFSLYSHPHSHRFLKDHPVNFEIDVVVWSSLSSAFTKTYIPEGRSGSLLLKIIGKLEDYFPHTLGRFGQYPLFVIKKNRYSYE